MDQSLASSEEHQDIQRGGSETAEQPASAPGEAHTRGTAGAAALEAVPAQHDLDPEAAAGVEGIHARATETSDSQIERTKRDLRMLDHLDPLVAQRLIAQDPTALDRLPTTTKIMKAIAMLTNASDDFYETNPRGHPGSNPGLPLAVYSNIVQLLASALIDVGDHNSIPPSSPHKTSPLELAYARSKLGLDPSAPMQLDTTHLPSLDTGALPSMQAPMPRPVPEVSLIFAENARLALAVLRPRALFPLDLDLSQSPVFSSKSPISDGCRPVPSQVSSLPSEIILLIFHFAHSAAAQADPGTLSDSRYRLTDYDDTPAESLTGSIAAAQRFALSLARVCKRWVIPARTVRGIFLRNSPASNAELDDGHMPRTPCDTFIYARRGNSLNS
ncbi:uncharacterized protein JCM15063_001778 [Sporobolomyces koalae]|uniref:uncharacterized protein n=1 Tax=Sporobolomyces koalae TaxID=500713 RepID=UPI003172E33A